MIVHLLFRFHAVIIHDVILVIQVESLGPGRYETKDFITILNEKPSSKKGVCETSDLRFPRGNIFKSKIPGPGTYGKGGIPWTAVEEKAKKSFCITGLLDSGQGHHLNMGTSGSGIAPGRYNHKNSIQEVLDKSVSVRGPYDLYTGERYVVPKLTVSLLRRGRRRVKLERGRGGRE